MIGADGLLRDEEGLTVLLSSSRLLGILGLSQQARLVDFVIERPATLDSLKAQVRNGPQDVISFRIVLSPLV